MGAYEASVKANYGRMTIKGRAKKLAIEETLDGMRSMAEARGTLYPLQFDQTAFEFGINKTFKAGEDHVLRAVAEAHGIDGVTVPWDVVEEVLKERTDPMHWKGKFKDGGYKYKAWVRMLTTMRQSGDRGTSSLNWLANVVWICISLCEFGKYDEFFAKMKKANGHKGWFSFPAWDGSGNMALCFNAEGDDLIGACTHKGALDRMLEMAHWVGWKAKMEVPEQDVSGNSHGTYVGYHFHTVDHVPCLTTGKYTLIPEIKRFLTTKSWAVSNMSLSAFHWSCALNYEVYAKGFEMLEPMQKWCSALAMGHRRLAMRSLTGCRQVVGSLFGMSSVAEEALGSNDASAILRDLSFKVGVRMEVNDAARIATSGQTLDAVSEESGAVALAMSSHACGHQWGALHTDDVVQLLGVVEIDPAMGCMDAEAMIPQCWR
jgi:hypothetical protein